MYKGYKIVEQVIHDYQHPDIRPVLQAPCGCNVFPVYEQDQGWFWQWVGDSALIDERIEDE